MPFPIVPLLMSLISGAGQGGGDQVDPRMAAMQNRTKKRKGIFSASQEDPGLSQQSTMLSQVLANRNRNLMGRRGIYRNGL